MVRYQLSGIIRQRQLTRRWQLLTVSELISKRAAFGNEVVVELGCGAHKASRSHIGVDVIGYPGVDVVGDAYEVLDEVVPGSVDRIMSSHFLEHLTDLRGLLVLAARALKPNGIFTATVPHFSNPHFYSDPTHRQAFGLYTMSYVALTSFTNRTVPQYDTPLPFHYASAKYSFKSTRPFYLRHAWKSRGRIFNLSPWLQELYEEMFVWRIPADEVTYQLVRLPGPTSGLDSGRSV